MIWREVREGCAWGGRGVTWLLLLIWNLKLVHIICLPSLVLAVACTLKLPVGALPVSREATIV